MDNENEFSYSSDNQFKQTKPKKTNHIGKNIFVPFVSGMAGASLVLGVCFGVPSVKTAILGETKTVINTSTNSVSQESTPLATNISNYSVTSSSVAKTVLPSIVGIEVTYNINSFWGSSKGTATGSGIIISKDGYIITNNHVVSTETNASSYYEITKATELKVKLYNDEKTYDAKVIGTDAYTDLAVIKIEADNLTPATLGNSDNVDVGEFAMALGNPIGMDFTVTAGIISAVNREVTSDDGTTYFAIQTDAAINSGNSGGALVNSNGEVIGINTLKLSGTGIEGIGFAIPINSTTDIISQLIEFKTVKRPYIGITGLEVDKSTAELYNLPTGVSIRAIDENSPAKEANLKVGDIITKIEGQEISTVAELNRIKYTYSIGDTITLTILRSGKEEEIKVTLVEEPSKEETNAEEKSFDSNSNEKNDETYPSNNTPSIWDFFR